MKATVKIESGKVYEGTTNGKMYGGKFYMEAPIMVTGTDGEVFESSKKKMEFIYADCKSVKIS